LKNSLNDLFYRVPEKKSKLRAEVEAMSERLEEIQNEIQGAK